MDFDGVTVQNIRAIQPIVDCFDCADTFIEISSKILRVEIGPETKDFVIVSDLASSAYFSEDGYSLCALEYTINVVEISELPDWLTINGAVATVTSESPLDQPEILTFQT